MLRELFSKRLTHSKKVELSSELIQFSNVHHSYGKTKSLENIDFDATELIQKIETIDSLKLKNIKIVESTHSIDLLSNDVSKTDLIKYIKKNISEQLEILCIGDRGKWPGNDFELLSYPYSLSVNEVSANSHSCWNLLIYEKNAEYNVKTYLNSILFTKGFFEFRYSKLEAKI